MFLTMTRCRIGIVGVALLSTALLTACGSKPESVDISKQLSSIYHCPLLVIKDVKKIDGAIGQDNQYEVAYTFKAEIEGGKEAAAKYFFQWIVLDEQIRVAEQNHTVWRLENDYGMDDYRAKQARAQHNQLRDQRAELVNKCYDPRNPETSIFLNYLRAKAREAVETGKAEIPVPVALQLQGGGVMRKAESGWVFAQQPTYRVDNVVQSDPVKFDRPSPPPPVAVANDGAGQLTPPAGELASISAQAGDITPIDVPPQAQGPSFDCAKASTQVEKAICGDAKLAGLDVAVANAYKNVLTRATDKDEAKAQQTEWRRKVRDACSSLECLAEAYQRRLDQLH